MNQGDRTSGEKVRLGSHMITADEIVAFAGQYDPQPFHLHDEAARKTHFGALCASGWHTCALWMRHLVKWTSENSPSDEGGVSPGIRNLKWPRPVFAGDTLTFFNHMKRSRASASRPGYQVIETAGSAINQQGEIVLSFDSAIIARSPDEAG